MTNASVKANDGKLILSLPNAQTPVVWQMDLDAAQAASFTVQEDKKQKIFSLIYKTTDGKSEEIAPFEDKDTAVAVLMQTADALQNASSASNVIAEIGPNTSSSPSTDSKNDKLGAILALLLVIVLFVIWMLSASNSSSLEEIGVNASGGSQAQSSSTAGVPVSADDFLNNR